MQTFTHHALRGVNLEINPYYIENSLQDDIFSFNEIDVFFTDGRKITVPIGEVIVHSPYPIDNILDQWGSSSGGNWSIFTYKVEEALTIENITINFSDALLDQLFVKIDSTNQA